ncbi:MULTISPECIES: hypothetical protein [unclassified Nodularia (in: cyanobacteria)]|uniref:hypothetical protein n=1 Tax=unclassified Nodularia (in: cyanobacteria) TaxID=2656917 RepID=UPI00187F688F|nr:MULTISPECIES: hypothetical protein [unclassified Nodularia (in: cyanobacteria)]MBE9201153.1 hypothetical protein [Nodularia sp. LEGE 06071]MCC2695436.1 hypothetical protein [Nodularia sp. LEGE 04288]
MSAQQKIINYLDFRYFWSGISRRFSTYYGNSKKNPLWLLMIIAGRFNIVRHLVVLLCKQPIKDNQYQNSSMFSYLEIDEILTSLKKDGIYLGIHLPDSIFGEIINFAQNNRCYGNGDYNYGFLYSDKARALQKYGKSFIRGDYYNTALLCPAIKKIAEDPKILELAHKYLEKTPVFTGSQLHWVFVENESKHNLNKAAMNFHYDLHDYRNLVFFFYLTDVNLSSSPHVYIRGSHKHKKLSYILSLFRRQSEAELLNYYGEERWLTICGKAGFGFVEDVFAFHKATSPISQDRLLLQIKFGIHNYGEHDDYVHQSLLQDKAI